MFEFRITKYDPAFRDPNGAYLRDDWTSVSDVGLSFDGKLLTNTEYRRVESAYIASALAFLRESGTTSLNVNGLEYHGSTPLSFSEGAVVSLEQAETILSHVLREDLWCKLEGPDSFIHIGYDYYMYVGVSVVCPQAQALAVSLGLFVESFQSPYGDADAAQQVIQAAAARLD
jgi:hypothetical protein